MNGIVLIDKQKGLTSFDVVYRARKILKIKKIGHAGTLDPIATGVLPLFIGRATKAIPYISDTDKTYIANFKLGITTDTYDSTGNVLKTIDKKVSNSELVNELNNFKGEIKQKPPLYSAIKYKGQPLYKYARAGQNVEVKQRTVSVYNIELLAFDFQNQEGKLLIECGKGSYIRSICNDLGDNLKVGGIMTGLRRIKACGFNIEECITLDELQNAIDNNQKCVLGVDNAFKDLDSVYLDCSQNALFCNGAPLILKTPPNTKRKLKVYGESFLGIAHLENNMLKADRVFYSFKNS